MPKVWSTAEITRSMHPKAIQELLDGDEPMELRARKLLALYQEAEAAMHDVVKEGIAEKVPGGWTGKALDRKIKMDELTGQKMSDSKTLDKTETFARWMQAGVAPSACEKLWEMAAVVRTNDSRMDELDNLPEEVRDAAFEGVWRDWGIPPTALRYMADQRAMRLMQQPFMREVTPSSTRAAIMSAWMDGFALGMNMMRRAGGYSVVDGTARQQAGEEA